MVTRQECPDHAVSDSRIFLVEAGSNSLHAEFLLPLPGYLQEVRTAGDAKSPQQVAVEPSGIVQFKVGTNTGNGGTAALPRFLNGSSREYKLGVLARVIGRRNQQCQGPAFWHLLHQSPCYPSPGPVAVRGAVPPIGQDSNKESNVSRLCPLASHTKQLVNAKTVIPLTEELPQPTRERTGQLVLRVWQRLKPQEIG